MRYILHCLECKLIILSNSFEIRKNSPPFVPGFCEFLHRGFRNLSVDDFRVSSQLLPVHNPIGAMGKQLAHGARENEQCAKNQIIHRYSLLSATCSIWSSSYANFCSNARSFHVFTRVHADCMRAYRVSYLNRRYFRGYWRLMKNISNINQVDSTLKLSTITVWHLRQRNSSARNRIKNTNTILK